MQSRRPIGPYAGATLVIGLALAGVCLARYPLQGEPLQWLLFAALVALTALGQYCGLQLAGGLRAYIDIIPIFAGLLLFNPALAILVAGLGSALGRLPQPRLLPAERVFGLGETLICSAGGALALQALTVTPWQPSGWRAWAALLAAVTVMQLAHGTVIAAGASRQQKAHPLGLWLSSLAAGLPQQAVMYALGLLAALVIGVYPWALILLAAPAGAVVVALQRLLARQAAQQQLAEQNAGLAAHVSTQAEQLRAAYAVLEETLDAKNQMLQNVSHELRTPLLAISGYTEALQEGLYGNLSPRQLDALGIVHRNTQQMIRLVNDLLALRTVDRSQLQLSDVYIDEVIEHVVASFGQRAAGAKATVHVACDQRIPVLRADGPRLEQVLGNLLDNAIKFSPSGGDITLRARSLDAFTLEISVEDHGIGIPREEIPRLYRRFYQVDGSSTRRFSGQGLGLAISKRIVELHGGGIRCQSEVGVGTTFFLTLPVVVPSWDLKLPEED